MQLIEDYFELSEEQKTQLSKLDELYKEWNAQINVISRKDQENFYERHVLHSLAIACVVDFKDGTRILDVGTGAGFPGLVLAIFNPDKKFFLVDGVSKKITFIDEMKGRLKLNNVTTYHSRVEDLKMNEGVDLVISRAFADIQKMMTLTKHLLKEKGKYLAMKGPDYLNEINNINGNNEIYDLKVPYFNGIRKLIEITKHD